jgi:hypothetical protein
MRIISSEVYEFERELNPIEKDHKWPRYEIEQLESNEADKISIELAVNNFGIHNEDKLNIDAKADGFIWHFRSPIMRKFIEILSK